MPTAINEYATTIARANDEFRRAGWGVTMTVGVQHLPDLNNLMHAVRMFDTFNEGNDPYGEHDFGKLVWRGSAVFWKIDYYNRALTGGISPLSPHCQRVLTVMLAEEY
jgi:hypothetical protein